MTKRSVLGGTALEPARRKLEAETLQQAGNAAVA